MIDMHSHILPNIDDGSRSIEETFNLIEEAQEAGFDAIISTSHYMEEYYEVGKAEREFWINALSDKLQDVGIDVKLFLGNEIYISENIIKLLQQGKACTINDTSYVLFEMPLNAEPLNLYDVVYEMLEHKLKPILAHPERYTFVQKNPELIYDLIEKGVLMQSNFGSFIGMYGEKAQIIAKKLLENDMVHFLGTDVHKEKTIYPKIPNIIPQIEQICGKEKLEQITFSNAMKVLKDEKIEIEDPVHIELNIKEKIKMETNNISKFINRLSKS